MLKRTKAYNDIHDRFGFFCNLRLLKFEELVQKCQSLSQAYPTGFSVDELISECTHFREYLHITKTYACSILHLYKGIHENKMKTTFPNISIAFRIFLTMMVTNCTSERSFSKLKQIKIDLRNATKQQRLNSLSLINIEYEVLDNIDFDNLIDDFARAKARRKTF